MTNKDRLDLALHILAAAAQQRDLDIARRALNAHDSIYRAERRLEELAFSVTSPAEVEKYRG